MTATLTLSESFISDMDWEDTQVHLEEMEWETICTYDSEPMDWEDIPQVRAFKRSKVSEPVECNIPLQVKAAPPASKKVSPPPNLTSLQENATPPQPKKVFVTLDPKPNPYFTGDTSNSPKSESLFFRVYSAQNSLKAEIEYS
ncbi:hypothetical protein TNCT_434751 [Trichonephila clavata]|uniref:Uncharacterized protein n=1 Tax=Trichonephila clavata TaxID=2740835 RepID=A0A8X6LRW1_TRICU|nr:hypothetical protein TNCT_434751 [Trichonephila clavata]